MKQTAGKKKKNVRLLAMLLASVMLFTTQGMTTLASTARDEIPAVEVDETGAGAGAETGTETGTEPGTETGAESGVETGAETGTEPGTEIGVESGVETGVQGVGQADDTQGTEKDVISETLQAAGVPAGTPENPKHNCNTTDKNDTTTWSYVYFGSYPKSEVTDSATQTAIDNAIAAGKGSTDVGTDVWINGTKYRRISKEDTSDDYYFGTSTTYRYFKWERIRWRVLENDGAELFMVADQALDGYNYHTTSTNITWQNCSLRSWLNGSFYQTAFSGSEQSAIISKEVENADNDYYSTDSGNQTIDRICVLSLKEVTNKDYGFCTTYDRYSPSRWVECSDYAHVRGVGTGIYKGYGNNCQWWLRTAGSRSDYAAYVYYNGCVVPGGCYVAFSGGGVVPALHITLSSNAWSMEDDGTSGYGGDDGHTLLSVKATKTKRNYVEGERLKLDDLTVEAECSICGVKTIQPSAYSTNAHTIDMSTPGEKILNVSYTENGVTKKAEILITVISQGTPANPIHNCSNVAAEDITQWSYVYFGSYPQSQVTDSDTIAAIEAKIAEISAEDSGYAGEKAETGTDVWVEGTKYRKLTTTSPLIGKINKYYRWERIKWKVLRNNGENLFLLADQPLDCKTYNSTLTDTTWKDSTLRAWLGNGFYHAAFSESEKSAIVSQTIVNEDNAQYGTEGGNNTTDQIFLLSISEVTNEDYGFCGPGITYAVSRRVQPSAYACERGAWKSTSTQNEGTGRWWLRSPGMNSTTASVIFHSGLLNGGHKVNNSDNGVVPAMWIKLSSDDWLFADDGTSGAGGEEHALKSLKATKTKTTYIQGDSLNLNDLTVEAECSAHGFKTVQSFSYDTNADTIDMNTPGEKTLIVSYTENGVTKTAEILLTVSKKEGEEPGETPGDKPGETPGDKPGETPSDKPGETPGDKPGDKPGETPGGNPSTNPDGNPGGSQGSQTQQIKVTKLMIQAPSKKLAAGKKVKLAVTAAPADATNQAVTWTTSNAKYATIDQNGKLTLNKAGAGKTVTITALAQDGSGVKATLKITIMKDAVKSIKLKAPSKTLKAGKSMTIRTTIKTTGKKANKALKWTTSNETYATVNNKGKVTAKKAGKGKTVTITAQATDGSGKKAKVKIKLQ